jgi:membrane fusion protein (multidrug efflux system)
MKHSSFLPKGARVRWPVARILEFACLTLGILLSGVSCKKQAAAQAPAPVVQVMEVHGTNAFMATEIIGQLDSPQNVEVRARVEAFVDKVLFTEGTEVKEGETLYLLDKKPFEERLAAAKGALAEAKASLNKYGKDVARLKPLAEKRAIPQQDLDNAEASLEVGRRAC